jgi:transposase-like protein
MNGEKEVLGLWIAQTEGAKFWLQVVTELKNRGVQDSFNACVDGLKGFPEAIEAVYPRTDVQLCIVHMVRHSRSMCPGSGARRSLLTSDAFTPALPSMRPNNA